MAALQWGSYLPARSGSTGKGVNERGRKERGEATTTAGREQEGGSLTSAWRQHSTAAITWHLVPHAATITWHLLTHAAAITRHLLPCSAAITQHLVPHTISHPTIMLHFKWTKISKFFFVVSMLSNTPISNQHKMDVCIVGTAFNQVVQLDLM